MISVLCRMSYSHNRLHSIVAHLYTACRLNNKIAYVAYDCKQQELYLFPTHPELMAVTSDVIMVIMNHSPTTLR